MGYCPENNSNSLRAIDLNVDADSGNIHQWFLTYADMCQFLCALKVSVYVETDGTIKNQDGAVVGLWYYITLTTYQASLHVDVEGSDSNCKSSWGKALDRDVLYGAEPYHNGPIEMTDEELDEIDKLDQHFDRDLADWQDSVHANYDGVRASLEAEGPLTRQQELDLNNPNVVWENHGFGFRACVQQPPSIPECCDFGDDVAHTEDHDPSEDPLPTCTEPSCVNTRKWAKRREMADAHRGAIKANFGEMNPDFDELGQNEAHSWQADARGFDELELGPDGILCQNCGDIVGPYHDCGDEDLTEDEQMAQAGASDEEIASANYIDALGDKLTKAQECIGELLMRLDRGGFNVEMHWYGNSPSWYVEAAAISCGIDLDTGGNDPVDAGDLGAGTRANWREDKTSKSETLTALAKLHGTIVSVTVPLNDAIEKDEEEEESPSDQLIAERLLNSKLFRNALKNQKAKLDALDYLAF